MAIQYSASMFSQFERLGHPGNYYEVKAFHGAANHTLDLTGSNYGYGAIMVVAAGAATASLSGGGTIALNSLNTGVIYDISVKQISGSTGEAYAFKRK